VTVPSPGGFLRATVAAVLTAALLWLADPAAVADATSSADLSWIGVAILLVVADRALMAYRLVVLLHVIEPGGRPPLGPILRLFFISTFAGTFLPSSVGGDFVRAYGLSRLNVPSGTAVAVVVMDRLLGVISIVLMGTLGLWFAGRADLMSNQAVLVPLCMAGGCSLIAVAVIFSDRAASFAGAIALRLPFSRLRALAGGLIQATRAYARFDIVLLNVLSCSIAVQALRILQAYLLGLALGIAASPEVYLAFVPVVLLVMLMPITINGIGTSQAAFVWLFGLAGVPEAQAFALSILFLALGVVGNLPGGLLYAFKPGDALPQ
jgi:uncharacterized protein (TIRG00374 family)